MVHYIDAEKLIAEIERLEGENNCGTSDFIEAKRIAYNQVKEALDSLQYEQLEVDLEKELEKEVERFYRTDEYRLADTLGRGFETLARHFAEWGLNARKEDK